MYEIGPYLRAALKKKGMTQKALAREMGMSPEHISTICLGKRRPSFDALEKICAILDMSFSEFFADPSAQLTTVLSADEFKMLSDYRRLQQHERRVFADAIHSLHKTRPGTSEKEEARTFRSIDGIAAAGSPLFDPSNDISDTTVAVPPKYLDRNRFSIFAANGDSMEPAISNGDFVVVAHNVSPEQGEIALVKIDGLDIDGEYTIKRFHQFPDRIELRSFNSNYPTMTYDPRDLMSAQKVVHIIHATGR